MEPENRQPGRMEYHALDQYVLAVAVEGHADDWCAYIGKVPGIRHDVEFHQVANTGTKLPKDVAAVLFPWWTQELKWRH